MANALIRKTLAWTVPTVAVNVSSKLTLLACLVGLGRLELAQFSLIGVTAGECLGMARATVLPDINDKWSEAEMAFVHEILQIERDFSLPAHSLSRGRVRGNEDGFGIHIAGE